VAGREVALLAPPLAASDPEVGEIAFGPCLDVQFSPDGRQVLTVNRDARVKIEGPNRNPVDAPDYPCTPVRTWDTDTGKLRIAFAGFRRGVRSASFSADGKYIVAYAADDKDDRVLLTPGGKRKGFVSNFGSDADVPVRIWDAASGELVRALLDSKERCLWAGWAPDGRLLTITRPNGRRSADYKPLRIWDVATGQTLLALGMFSTRATIGQFSPDGNYLVGWTGGPAGQTEPCADLWDARTGNLLVTLAGHQGDITSAAFSPDRRWVVTTSVDGRGCLWRVDDGKPHVWLTGHRRTVHAAAFSADSRLVVTASEDGTARVWDTDTGAEWLTLAGHEGPVYSAVFAPDGKSVATASADGKVRVWPVDPLAVTEQRRPRSLTDAERTRFGLTNQE
jgi:WD40 repeat protein